jgi:hypothetical protein
MGRAADLFAFESHSASSLVGNLLGSGDPRRRREARSANKLFPRHLVGNGTVRENVAGDVLASLITMAWNAPSKSWTGGTTMADPSLNRRMTVRLGTRSLSRRSASSDSTGRSSWRRSGSRGRRGRRPGTLADATSYTASAPMGPAIFTKIRHLISDPGDRAFP